MNAQQTSGRPERASRARIGLIVLFVASEILGLLLGQWFFGIYTKTVPPAVVTGFNVATAHGMFLMNGAIAGLVIFLWSLLAAWLAPFFRAKRED
ncbi:MAG: hypothetical protein ACREAA_18415 [Candidatus Polarisedimenticolia bacterium]